MTARLTALLVAALLSCSALAQSIAGTGQWSETVDASDLLSGAGSDLASAYTSDLGVVTLDVSAASTWTLEVRRGDTAWHGDLILSVRRVSDGLGDGTISGGAEFQTVTGLDAAFFGGSGDRTDIQLQFRLEGMSVHVPPDAYTADAIFTITAE